MTTYTTLTDATLTANKPWTQSIARAVRDNPIAITEKAAGAPVLANNYVVAAMINAAAVTWGKISTSLQQSSGTLNALSSVQINFTGGMQTLGWAVDNTGTGSVATVDATQTSAYTAAIQLKEVGGSNGTYRFQANYVNSSPPWNLGDGDIPLFVFAEIRPDGSVVRVDVADAPPWGYNGPTSVRPTRESTDGRKFREVRKIIADHGTLAEAQKMGITPEMIFDRLATDPVVEEEITHEIKNRDMPSIPHPFGARKNTNNTIVLLDPVSPLIQKMAIVRMDPALDEPLTDMLLKGKFNIDNTPLVRAGPPGVTIVTASLR